MNLEKFLTELATQPAKRSRAEWSRAARRVLAGLVADPDASYTGWRPWTGAHDNRKRPVPGPYRVEVRHRDGSLAGPARALAFGWTHFNESDDIVAYRRVRA